MPGPVSWILKRTARTPHLPSSGTSTKRSTRPFSVNLMALPSRFKSTCITRFSSATTVSPAAASRLVGEADLLLEGAHLRDVRHGAEHRRELEGPRRELHLASLDLGEIEHVVDEHQQVLAAPLDDLDAFLLVGREVFRALEDLREAEDAVQRGAQLVAHAREELALGLVGAIGGLFFELALVARALQGDLIAHPRQELLHRKRLCDVVLGALAKQPRPVLVVGPGGEEHDRDPREFLVRAHRRDELIAALAGHHHVAQHEVRLERNRLLEALLAIRGGRHAVVGREARRHELAHLVVVLDDQHERARAFAGGRSPAARPARTAPSSLITSRAAMSEPPVAVASMRRAFRRAQGKLHGEQGASLGGDADGGPPLVQLGELADDGEAEPRSAVPPRGAALDLIKTVEDAAMVLRGDAGPAVGHGEKCPLALDGLERAPHLAPARRELERVREQVGEDALDLLGVDLRGEAVGGIDDVRDAAVARDDLERGGDEAHELGEVHGGVARLHEARVEAGDVEQVVHLPEQDLGVALDALEIGPLLRLERARREAAGRRGRGSG